MQCFKDTGRPNTVTEMTSVLVLCKYLKMYTLGIKKHYADTKVYELLVFFNYYHTATIIHY